MYSAQNILPVKVYGRIVTACLILLFTHLTYPLTVQAQTGLTLTETFEEAERLFFANELDRSFSLFNSLSNRLCGSENYNELCVRSFIYRGTINRYDRNFNKAEDYYEKAENEANSKLTPGHELLVDLYVQRTYLSEEKNDLEGAKNWLNRIDEYITFYSLPNISKSKFYLVKADLKSVEGDYRESINIYDSALELLSELEKTIEVMRLLSQVHNNIGVDYRRLGMPERAMLHYKQAEKIVAELYGSNHPEMALIYNNLGSFYYGTGDYGTAADFFIRSASIFRDTFGKVYGRVAIAYNNAGICYFQLGDLDSAAEYFELALEIRQQIYDEAHIDLAVGYNTLGSLYSELNQFEEAEKNYHLSIDVRIELYGDDHPSLIPPYTSLSGLYVQLERESEARMILDTALNIGLNRLGKSHPEVLDLYSLYGLSYLNQNNLELAGDYYDKVLNSLISDSGYGDIRDVRFPIKVVDNIKERVKIFRELYKQSINEDYLFEALKFTEIASDIIDNLQTSYQSEASKLNLIESNYEIYSNAIDINYELFRSTGESVWIDHMFYYSEKSRSRIASELLQKVEAINFGGVPEAVILQERELNQKITKYFQQIGIEEEKGGEADRVLISSLKDSLFYVQRDLTTFSNELEKNYPSYFELKYDNRLVERESVQSVLAYDEIIISYSFGADNLYALVIEKERLNVFRLDITVDLSGQVRSLIESVTRGKTNEFRDLSHKLYVQLIEPVLLGTENKKITFYLDQYLHYLPFELLLTNNAQDIAYHEMPFLVRNYTIRYSPSAAVMMSKLKTKPENPQNLLALAPFNEVNGQSSKINENNRRYLGQLTPLPLTGYETREIAKLFRERDSIWKFFFPEQAVVLTNNLASKSRLMNGSLSDYGFIHFATHAFINDNNPALSGIALRGSDNDDGIIYINDIYNLQMNADLVVLGACDTGLGQIRKGEGMIGFTRAFHYAGASNLVVSMWRVNDQPTANLMIEFYKQIRSGKSYSEALRSAKLELINHPEYAAPRNWAAFILNGS